MSTADPKPLTLEQLCRALAAHCLLTAHPNLLHEFQRRNPRMTVEPKGVDAFEVDNHARIIVCTNELHALYAHAHERRYAVIRVSDARQEDYAYFTELRRWMDTGIAALLHFLQQHGFSGLNLRQVPRTKALLEQKENSFSLVERTIYEALNSGYWANGHPWEAPIDRAVLLDAINAAALRHERYISPTQLGQQLRVIFTELGERRPVGGSGAGRRRLYAFPRLDDARRLFSEHVRQPIAWEELDEPEVGPRVAHESSGPD